MADTVAAELVSQARARLAAFREAVAEYQRAAAAAGPALVKQAHEARTAAIEAATALADAARKALEAATGDEPADALRLAREAEQEATVFIAELTGFDGEAN